jgi:hypothetical protein
MLGFLILLLLTACSEAPPGLLGSPSAESPGTPVVTPCLATITTDETPYLGGIASLTWQADLVIEGTVIQSLPSVWLETGDVRQITTDSVVHVDQRITGDAGDTVRIRRSGGTVGCSSLGNAVSPRLGAGDRLLLFLRKDDTPGLPSAYRLLGQGQGYWQITTRDQVELAIKFFHTDTGTVGNPNSREDLQGILDKVTQARASGTPTPDDGKAVGMSVSILWATSDGTIPLFLDEGIVVTGKVVKALPAEWTTRDGRRPTNFLDSVPDDQTIVTPIVIELDAGPLYDSYGLGGQWHAGQQLTVVTERGDVGGSAVDYGPVYVPGERVLLMLSYFRYLGGGFGRVMTPNGLAWNVSSKFVAAGDRIFSPNPNDPPGSLQEFEQRIEAVQQGTP